MNAQFLVGALFAPYVSTSKTYRCPADGSVEKICGMGYWRVSERLRRIVIWSMQESGLDGIIFCG